MPGPSWETCGEERLADVVVEGSFGVVEAVRWDFSKEGGGRRSGKGEGGLGLGLGDFEVLVRVDVAEGLFGAVGPKDFNDAEVVLVSEAEVEDGFVLRHVAR